MNWNYTNCNCHNCSIRTCRGKRMY